MIAQILDIVLNVEPLFLVLSQEVYSVTDLKVDVDEVFRLDVDDVRHKVIVNPEIHVLHQVIGRFRFARGKFEDFQRLVVLKQDGRRLLLPGDYRPCPRPARPSPSTR